MSKRFPEIDLLRTLAIACMVVYHAAYDLAVLYGRDIPVFDTGWTLFARATANLFLLLVGIGFAISASRKESVAHLWKKQGNRFLTLAGAAALVSVATYLIDPHTFVRFGILHLIALSMLLLPVVRPLREGSVLLGGMILATGMQTLQTKQFQPLATAFGFPPPDFATVDYFPVLPWFGTVLIGYGLGHLLYVRFPAWRKRLPDSAPNAVTWPGRHSLMIYLLHQPIILSLLYILL